MSSIADIRKEYMLKKLEMEDVDINPFSQFTKWWHDAMNSKIDEVNAFTLATASLSGKPSARIVLLKDYDESGFIFFTNYTSNKGNQLAHNAEVALVFFWKELERQVRIEGIATKVSGEISDAYFLSRPPESQIGAWASPQSKVIENRNVIEENVLKYQKMFEEQQISRPQHWGGYQVSPTMIEFWQGRPGRLHDRIQYCLQEDYSWKIERLAP